VFRTERDGANRDAAARYGERMAGKATPATRAAQRAGIAFRLHEYDHDPAADSYALEAATALGLDPGRVFKTLVVDRDGTLVVCIVPAAAQLDLRALGKHAAMAPAERAERVTGYVAGGISPLGQRRRLATLIDDSALGHATIFVSAGRRGLEIELSPRDLVALTDAEPRMLRRAADEGA
jgi:Cys-tRNA(Pro)/Cys-tRNA(Cys) deacylase